MLLEVLQLVLAIVWKHLGIISCSKNSYRGILHGSKSITIHGGLVRITWLYVLDEMQFLKQDNITMKEAFQKSLDEDLSHTISSGYSKGRVSHFRGHTTSESPKGKMQKQIKTARNQKEVGSPSMRIGSSNKQKEGSSKQKRKYDARDKAARNTKTKEDEGREQRINVKYGKEAIGGNSIRQEQTMEMFSNEVAGNRAMEQGEARKNIAMKMVRIAASTCKNMKPSDFEEQKRGNATQPKKIESLKSDHQAKFSAPESAVDISARKTKVMRSLGLIPPSGSPFHRNRILEVAHLKT
ncbi:uncharacterized protein LOC103969167 isoform X9 [Musa acuminata AAA Group]|uniref:uncharacterized protein LOC103969167 isoform X9 n=1 Tax=Musa acuminata AAA Group TaxID=214697 RepID=UPI0031D87C37